MQYLALCSGYYNSAFRFFKCHSHTPLKQCLTIIYNHILQQQPKFASQRLNNCKVNCYVWLKHVLTSVPMYMTANLQKSQALDNSMNTICIELCSYDRMCKYAYIRIKILLHVLLQLKAMSETPLMGLLMDTEKEKPTLIQVPTLSKPSMYHKVCVQMLMACSIE